MPCQSCILCPGSITFLQACACKCDDLHKERTCCKVVLLCVRLWPVVICLSASDTQEELIPRVIIAVQRQLFVHHALPGTDMEISCRVNQPVTCCKC